MNSSSPSKKTASGSVFDSETEAEVLAQILERLAHDGGNFLARILAIGEEFQFHLEDGAPFPEGPRLMHQNVLQTKDLMRRIAELPRKSGSIGYHDLNALLADAVDLVRKFLPRSVELKTQFAGELLPVSVDPLAFRWMVIELAWLAAAASSQSGSLSFETSRQAGPGQARFSLVLAVADLDQPLVRFSGTGPNHLGHFIERCDASFAIENETAYQIWLPEAEMSYEPDR